MVCVLRACVRSIREYIYFVLSKIAERRPYGKFMHVSTASVIRNFIYKYFVESNASEGQNKYRRFSGIIRLLVIVAFIFFADSTGP